MKIIRHQPKKEFKRIQKISLVCGSQSKTQERQWSICRLCEKRFGWCCVQIAIHNDEREKGENGELKRKNRHAHLEFCMLDKDGIYRFKKRDFQKNRCQSCRL